MALLRRDAEAAWLHDLVPGGLKVTTFTDDEVAHERLLLWPVDRKNVYIEPVVRDEDRGVADTIPLDDVGTVPATSPMKVHRFRECPNAEGLRELLRDGRAVVRTELGREAPEVATVLTPACERVPLEDLAPGLLATRRTRGEVSPKAAAAASARRPAGPAPGLAGSDGRPLPAPPPVAPSDQLTAVDAADAAEGYIWALAEPTGRRAIGAEIDGGANVLLAPGGLDGLAKLDDHWRRIEGMAPEAAPGYTKHRSDELKESLGIAKEEPCFDEAIAKSLGSRWSRSSSETRESQRMEGPPIAFPMSKRIRQGGPSLMAARVNIGGLLRIEAICRRMAGIVAACANRAKPAWDLTRYCTSQQSAEDVVGPEMRSFVPWRAKEDRETGAGGLRGSPAEHGAGGRVAATRGPRDLFPAPLLDTPPPLAAASAGAARARRREQLEIGVANEEVAKYLVDYQERMLRQGDILPKIEPYLDPKLKFHQKECQRLVRDLFDIGMVDWTTTPKCRIGLFCVPMSDGKSLRLIVDARRANEVFADPPAVDLLTAEGFGRGEAALPAGMAPRSPEAVEYLSKLRLVVGTSDVANCFHCLKLGPEMSAHFGLPAAPAHVFGLEGAVAGGRHLGRASPVYPAWAVLPMGFTWSLWFAQRMNELQTRYEVGEAISGLQRHFADLGLVLHESSVTDEACKTLGVELLGEGLRSRVTSERWWLIRRAVEATRDPAGVSAVGRALERSRFKRSGGCGARESTLEAAGFWRDTSGKWRVTDSGADPRTEGAWALDFSYAEVPARCRDFRLLVIIRRIQAYCLSGSIQLLVRWIPSEFSFSDLGSRVFSGPDASDPLVDELDARLGLSPLAVRPSATGRKRKLMGAGGRNEVDDSGGATSEQGGGERAVPKRAAALRKKARQRRSKFLSEAATRAMDGGLNFLEASSVTKPARGRCERVVVEFIDYCDRPPALALRSAVPVDKALSQHFNYQFFQGHEAARGGQAFAGLMLMFSRPEFGKVGSQKLPNAWWVLRGWRKRAPARSRRARALGVWAALARRLGATQGLLMSKTGLADVCIALDSKRARCSTPLWPLPAKDDPDDLVFTFEYLACVRAFQSIVKELGIEDRIIPYQARHSGPSIDASRRWRTADEVQRRGQWKQARSPIRYEKGARLGESWAGPHPRPQVVCELCGRHFADIVLRRPHP
ncbi:unnamed protein product, partial [Prorocentrum cordatum]